MSSWPKKIYRGAWSCFCEDFGKLQQNLKKEAMKKIKIEASLKQSLEAINAANTLNGGMAQTQIQLGQNETGYYASFYTPSAGEQAFKIILNANHLAVYSLVHLQLGEERQVEIPTLLTAFPVPYFVDVEQIEALYERGTLEIFAPFKPGMNPSDSTREIPIKKL